VRALSGDRLKRMLALRDGYERRWRRAVTAGVEAGCLQAEMPGIAARSLLQMATGVSHWFSPSGSLKLGQLCRLYSDGALGFLRARKPDGAPLTRADLKLPAPDHYLR
jgi:TetR/AcrR family transcriptional regulator, cholesterol catabolism regulator